MTDCLPGINKRTNFECFMHSKSRCQNYTKAQCNGSVISLISKGLLLGLILSATFLWLIMRTSSNIHIFGIIYLSIYLSIHPSIYLSIYILYILYYIFIYIILYIYIYYIYLLYIYYYIYIICIYIYIYIRSSNEISLAIRYLARKILSNSFIVN